MIIVFIHRELCSCDDDNDDDDNDDDDDDDDDTLFPCLIRI